MAATKLDSPFWPTQAEIETACAAFLEKSERWPGTLPMSFALEAANRVRESDRQTVKAGFALWAPGVGYNTGRVARDGYRVWGCDLKDAHIYTTFASVVSGLMAGDGDPMAGVEIRRVSVTAGAPILRDKGAVT